MIRPARPQTDYEKAADLGSWRRLGLAGDERTAALPRDPRLCCGLTKYQQPCCAWGGFLHDGKRYCQAHHPPFAERR